MKYTFPRDIRLTNEAQFRLVFRKTKPKIIAETFTIYYCLNAFFKPRLGVIVPKKNVNKSSERNSFKRTVREGFRLKQNKLGKFDIVVLVNKNTKGKSKKELNQCLENQLNKLII